jgi:hypothetical protein
MSHEVSSMMGSGVLPPAIVRRILPVDLQMFG